MVTSRLVAGAESSIMNSVAVLPAAVMPFPSWVRYLVEPEGTGPINCMAVATVWEIVWAGGFAKNLLKVAPASVMALVMVSAGGEGVLLSSFLSFFGPSSPFSLVFHP